MKLFQNPNKSIVVLSVLALVVMSVTGCALTGQAGKAPAPMASQKDDTITLKGTVYSEKFFGPPNYGENPESDKVEIAFILKLNKPLNFTSETGQTISVEEVQLVNFEKVASGEATFRGQLDEAISGHHRRLIILVRERNGGRS